MLPKNDSFINDILSQSGSATDYVSTARPAFYIEVFEGSIYDWIGQENVGATPVWNRHDTSELRVNLQVGQSRTCSATLPISNFRNPATNYLKYDYDAGIYTTSDDTKRISKGFLLRGYIGYSEFEAPYTEHVVRKFTGVIDSIIVNDDSGTIEINAVDFSVIFMNTLNYNYPDINSYRDIEPEATTSDLNSAVSASTPSPMTIEVTNISNWSVGDKIKIGGEIDLILNVNSGSNELIVQRLSGITNHSIGDDIYKVDGYLVGPEDVYDNKLLSKYVPAYDNWRLKDAIRDLCIKAKFPLSLLSVIINDADTLRLGTSDKYPYMKQKTIIESFVQQYQGQPRSFTKQSFNSDGQISYDVKVEKKVYLGLDDDQLNEAKFKFEFGKSLWDCIIGMVEGFGFRVYFDVDGKLVVKSVRQSKWLAPLELDGQTYIENHCWSWIYWNIYAQADKRYTVNLGSTTTIVKARFIAKETATNSITVRLQKYNTGTSTWENVTGALEQTVPALQPYQFYEIQLYAISRDTNTFAAGLYGVKMTTVGVVASPPMFNGFLYLDNYDETISYDILSVFNAQVNSMSNAATEVRNQMTIIGQPKAPVPIVSRVQDTASMMGGQYCLASVADGATTYDRATSNNFLMDGKYDTYSLVHTNSSTVYLNASSSGNIRRVILYVKPQSTPLGTTISFYNGVTLIGTHTVTQDDLGSGGLVFCFGASYSQIKITSNIDLYISEIEAFSDEQSYNFVGFKKETLVIKSNISDKATCDWMALTQLEMHRRNTKSLPISCLGNPYVEVGDCCTVDAPEVGAYYDTKLWINGVTTTISAVNYVDELSVTAIPPMQSYVLPPRPNSTSYPDGDVYDFSISKYKVGELGANALSTVPYAKATTSLTAKLTPPTKVDETTFTGGDTYLEVGGTTGFSAPGLVKIQWGAWVEFIYIESIDVSDPLHKKLVFNNWRTNRGRNNTVVRFNVSGSPDYSYPANDTSVEQVAVMQTFTPVDHYLTFNFAIPEAKKVQVVVGVSHINQVLAYVLEEKVLPAGVYKRENGIRWDGGINFAKVWPESVDKIYLGPQESFNYMYNRMFNPWATSQWENTGWNYYWWNFDQNITAEYKFGEDVKTGNAVTSGWVKTPYQWNATLIVKPVLAGYTGPTTSVKSVTRQIDIRTSCPAFKIVWGTVTPKISYQDEFPVVTASIKLRKYPNGLDGSPDADAELNDSVYLDAYVMGGAGENVNAMTVANAGKDTAKRWVAPIGLVSYISWPFTDSQGKFVPAGLTTPTYYKFALGNVFDVYGEGVEVLNTTSYNLIDGCMKVVWTGYGVNGYSPVNLNPTLQNWEALSSNTQSVQNNKPVYAAWPGQIQAYKGFQLYWPVQQVQVWFTHSFKDTGGQQNDKYVEFEFVKRNLTYSWTRENNKPNFGLRCKQETLYRPNAGQDMYFRLFYKPGPKPVTSPTVDPGILTVDNLVNPYFVMIYRDTTGIDREFIKKITFDDFADSQWHSASITFNKADVTDLDVIKSVMIEFRPGDSECPQAILDSIWPNSYTIGIDSVEFGPGNVIPPTYVEPGGGPRISEMFELYTTRP